MRVFAKYDNGYALAIKGVISEASALLSPVLSQTS